MVPSAHNSVGRFLGGRRGEADFRFWLRWNSRSGEQRALVMVKSPCNVFTLRSAVRKESHLASLSPGLEVLIRATGPSQMAG